MKVTNLEATIQIYLLTIQLLGVLFHRTCCFITAPPLAMVRQGSAIVRVTDRDTTTLWQAQANGASPVGDGQSQKKKKDKPHKLEQTHVEDHQHELLHDDDEHDFEILFEDHAAVSEPSAGPLDPIERAWRYVKKPLLRIGSKGATLTHGNSLRHLLDSHTIVKVKVNTRRFGSLELAFQHLKELAQESGAAPGIELIQAREIDKTILFGVPGTLDRIRQGEFPPPQDTNNINKASPANRSN